MFKFKKRKKKAQDLKRKKTINSVFRILLTVFLVFFIFFSGAYLATENKVVGKLAENGVLYKGKLLGKYDKVEGQWAQNINFNLYWEVWSYLKNEHPNKDKITDKELFYGSLKGLVGALEDPYSEFMDPKETKDFTEDMSGSFEGIGAEVGIRDDLLTIISPIEGTPAFEAGLLPGDKILEINGELTKSLNLNEAVSKIRGPKGTEVRLTIFRDYLETVEEITIIRDKIVIKSVESKKIDQEIFLINITAFNDDTLASFHRAVEEFLSSGAKYLILDLRGNPGGYLETAVALLGEWINGEVAVIEEFAGGQRLDYTANGLNRLQNYPTVVLLNAGSASASEIMAGALKDYNKATIIGEKSYGKGSVQVVRPLKDGSTLKLSVAKWMTPNGLDIGNEGINPDIEVILSYDDYVAEKDPQLVEASKFLKNLKK